MRELLVLSVEAGLPSVFNDKLGVQHDRKEEENGGFREVGAGYFEHLGSSLEGVVSGNLRSEPVCWV